MDNGRRSFLRSSGCSAAVAALPFLHKPALASAEVQLESGTFVTVSDGNLVLPGNFVVPADFPADELSAFLKENSLPEDSYQPACNVSLLKYDDRVVLFDVGSGANFMPSAGKLLEELESTGIDVSDVTDVVFTHGHPDHLWGLIDDFDELAFPEADFHMNSVEWDYWRATDTLDKTPEARKSFVVGARNRLSVIEDRIRLFNYGDEVVSGVEAVNTAGHTPGHSSFAIHLGPDPIMVLGDAITHPVLSFKKYEWASGGDQDPSRAGQTRKQLLGRLAHDKMQIVGFHLPYPGLGRVERSDKAYRYVAG